MNSATIIIPTLNEEDNIDILLKSLSEIKVPNCTLDILFADDQSSDNTIAKIQQWQKISSHIHYLQRTTTPDLTQSVIDGVKACKTDFILVMDADLSHPIHSIPDLLAPLLSGQYDISIGSRYTKGGGIKSWPIKRRLLSWVGGLPARIITDVNDTTSGFFACKRQCFEQISSEAKGYKVLIELLAANLEQYDRCEVPITFTDRVHGESKLSGKQISQYISRLTELSGFQFVSPQPFLLFLFFSAGLLTDISIYHWLTNLNFQIASAQLASYACASTVCFYLISQFIKSPSLNTQINYNFNHVEKIFCFITFALLIRCVLLSIMVTILDYQNTYSLYIAAILSTGILLLSTIISPYGEKHSNVLANLSIRWRVVTIATLAFTLLMKATYMFSSQLIPDEAYYWNYQEFIALSYLDHPPLIAWITWLTTNVFGDNEFAVRLVPLLAGLGVIYFIFKTTATLFDKTSAYISIFLCCILPLTFLSSFFATTDTLQMLFWAGCLYFIVLVIQKNLKRAWIGIGICIGLGMLAKYTISLIVLSLILFTIIIPAQRKWFAKPIVYASAGMAILLFTPVIYWNYANDWSSFSFQTTRRIDKESEFSLHYLLLHIFMMLGPIGLYLYANSVTSISKFKFKLFEKKSTDNALRYYFFFFTLIPLSVFIYFSVSHYPRFHWTAPVWLAAIPLMSHAVSPTYLAHTKRMQTNIIIYFSAAIALIYLLIFNFASLGIPVTKHTNFADHFYWKEVAEKIHDIEQKVLISQGKRPVIIGLSKWSIASALRFYDIDRDSQNILSRNALGRTASMFEEWTNPKTWDGHPVIYVAINPNDLTSTYITQHSKGLSPPQSMLIKRTESELRELHLRFADQYTP